MNRLLPRRLALLAAATSLLLLVVGVSVAQARLDRTAGSAGTSAVAPTAAVAGTHAAGSSLARLAARGRGASLARLAPRGRGALINRTRVSGTDAAIAGGATLLLAIGLVGLARAGASRSKRSQAIEVVATEGSVTSLRQSTTEHDEGQDRKAA